MAASRRLLFALALPPVVATIAIHRGLSVLEARYPALPVDASTSSPALRTPSSPSTQHCAYVDIYAARVPVRALLARTAKSKLNDSSNASLSTAWAQAVLGSRLFRLEASIVGLARHRKYDPGDIGDTPEEFGPDLTSCNNSETGNEEQEEDQKRKLIHGILTVERPPSNETPYGLLVSWKGPDELRLFFEKIARWGYPFRLMSGGRHEMSVSEPFVVAGREDEGLFVEVRFSSAHDYELVSAEGERQKILPLWSVRLHRGYARLLLDVAVRELSR